MYKHVVKRPPVPPEVPWVLPRTQGITHSNLRGSIHEVLATLSPNSLYVVLQHPFKKILPKSYHEIIRMFIC